MANKNISGGHRVKGYNKHSKDKQPLVSVVTVVMNSVNTIEETIISVLHQSYNNIEFIIIDGVSTDGTLDVIREYDIKIDYWISEADNGIYDAMNKGLELAKGDYIHFLNADDHYVHSRIIQLIVDKFNETSCQCIVGSVLMLDKTGVGYIRHSDVNKYYFLFKGIPQQAYFYSTKLFVNKRFDDTMEIASDLDFNLSCLTDKGTKIITVRWPIVVFNTGATSSNSLLLEKERKKIIKKYYSFIERMMLNNRFVERLLVTNELMVKKRNLLDRILRKISN